MPSGLGTIADFLSFSESDIEDVCKIVRSPGGTIPNPNSGRGGIGIPNVLPNPGVQICHLHEKKLKMLRYFLSFIYNEYNDTSIL
jgi:hypothetical protein